MADQTMKFDYEISSFRSAVGAVVVWAFRDRMGLDDEQAAALGLVVGFLYDRAVYEVKKLLGHMADSRKGGGQ